MKYSLLLLIFVCGISYSQDLDSVFEQWSADKGVQEASMVVEAALDCAAIADIASWNTSEHRRLMAVAVINSKEAFAPLVEGFELVISTSFETAKQFPLNPITGKPFDSKTDEWINLWGFETTSDWSMFQLGSMYGKANKKFFDEIPFGSSAEIWKINIEAEFNKRNCSLIGK